MNHSRRDRFNRKDGIKMDQIDNEFQMFAELWNTHDSGLRGWTALSLLDGANKRMGQATLVAGEVAVSNTSVTDDTRIFLSHETAIGTLGHLHISARSAGVSFTITSSEAADESVVNWLLIEPK